MSSILNLPGSLPSFKSLGIIYHSTTHCASLLLEVSTRFIGYQESTIHTIFLIFRNCLPFHYPLCKFTARSAHQLHATRSLPFIGMELLPAVYHSLAWIRTLPIYYHCTRNVHYYFLITYLIPSF